MGAPMMEALPGSSPRGRGKLSSMFGAVQSKRLIPARAGKTSFLIVGELELGAHPRAGGENTQFSEPSLSSDGSSPRGRGKPAPSPQGRA